MTWQLIEGVDRLPVTLFEAAYGIDEGDIYLQSEVALEGWELIDDLRVRLADSVVELCQQFARLAENGELTAHPQTGDPTYFRRRNATDSELDVGRTLSEQFNLLRTVDNVRYPAWFRIAGKKYRLHIEHHADNRH